MNHSTLIAIRGKISKLDNPNSSFKYTSFDQKLKELEKLDRKKTSQLNDIPVKVIKENKDIVAFSYIITLISHYQAPLFLLR